MDIGFLDRTTQSMPASHVNALDMPFPSSYPRSAVQRIATSDITPCQRGEHSGSGIESRGPHQQSTHSKGTPSIIPSSGAKYQAAHHRLAWQDPIRNGIWERTASSCLPQVLNIDVKMLLLPYLDAPSHALAHSDKGRHSA